MHIHFLGNILLHKLLEEKKKSNLQFHRTLLKNSKKDEYSLKS